VPGEGHDRHTGQFNYLELSHLSITAVCRTLYCTRLRPASMTPVAHSLTGVRSLSVPSPAAFSRPLTVVVSPVDIADARSALGSALPRAHSTPHTPRITACTHTT
jgi:hypothetical protein